MTTCIDHFKVVPETGSVSFQIHWIFVGFRVNNYINSGLSPNPVGPDGGNLQKKHLRLGLEQDISPLTDVLFRQDGFEVGKSMFLKLVFVKYGNISQRKSSLRSNCRWKTHSEQLQL